ncbi:MAG: hypothetical protein Q4C47_07925, partial [Planctomycetia bacterium]|nr:hypothetical protein [Planctomycetia bacterium]
EKDQAKVAETIRAMNGDGSPESEFIPHTYTFHRVAASSSTATRMFGNQNSVTTQSMTAIQSVLRQLFPGATILNGSQSNQLIILADVATHERIAAAVAEMNRLDAESDGRVVRIYTVTRLRSEDTSSQGGGYFFRMMSGTSTGVTSVLTILQTMYPAATFNTGPQEGQFTALAIPEEQERIAATLAELDKDEPAETAKRMELYTLKSGGVSGGSSTSNRYGRYGATSGGTDTTETIITLLQQIYPNATFSAGPTTGSIAAYARPDDHVKIAKSIEELDKRAAPGTIRQMKTYVVDGVSGIGGSNLLMAFQSAFPSAQFVQGDDARTFVVWAAPADHEEIQEAINSVSVKETEDQSRRAETYSIDTIDATTALSFLQSTFPDATFTSAAGSGSVVAYARPADHVKIREMLEGLRKSSARDPAAEVRMYPVGEASTYTMKSSLDNMVDLLGLRAEITTDYTTGSVMVVARPEVQTIVAQALEQLMPEPRVTRILELRTLDTSTVETMINTVFATGRDAKSMPPDLDIDPATQAIFITATEAQFERMYEVLTQMGETGARSLVGGRSGGTVRVIAVPPGRQTNLEESLQKAIDLWNQSGSERPITVERGTSATPTGGTSAPLTRGSATDRVELERALRAAGVTGGRAIPAQTPPPADRTPSSGQLRERPGMEPGGSGGRRGGRGPEGGAVDPRPTRRETGAEAVPDERPPVISIPLNQSAESYRPIRVATGVWGILTGASMYALLVEEPTPVAEPTP